jgi:hypothetical protein
MANLPETVPPIPKYPPRPHFLHSIRRLHLQCETRLSMEVYQLLVIFATTKCMGALAFLNRVLAFAMEHFLTPDQAG